MRAHGEARNNQVTTSGMLLRRLRGLGTFADPEHAIPSRTAPTRRHALSETLMDEPVEDPTQPIQIQLTPEQQQLIRRLSGQFAQVLELTPDATGAPAGEGRGLQFRWRLSVATGIPRQQWGPGGKPPADTGADPSA
jgi:hypothetical protein